MSDTFNVTASYSKASYIAGETIAATITGTNTHSDIVATRETVGPMTIPVVSDSGAKSTVSIPAVEVTRTSGATVEEAVFIDTSRAVVDSGPTPRMWVVSADRKSITATA